MMDALAMELGYCVIGLVMLFGIIRGLQLLID